ncbi:Chromosome-partitioning protein ParB [uncultured Alphaproteobacteria bacterium]|uniref:Chromosome-partitioning protein ParB n=1 Tax=uncultured Alphaproteobacteria bacterium TaxID=91750 RepID=A0A212KBF3_9PROT|nr:Chromosome-partitioning protein ParB [uncultured Alphaproteobacteria bacterium]
MSEEPKRRNLGRGLSALLGDDPVPAETPQAPQRLPVSALTPSPFQPRQTFDEGALDELAASVAERGVLQPLLVRPAPGMNGIYEIIAGERRWRAAQRAQVHDVPVMVREMDDREVAEVALVENLQRQDLNALEEADGYRRLQEEFHHTQEDLAKAVGKSRSHVANTLRLLGLPEAVKEMVQAGDLSAGHARALLGNPRAIELARDIVAKGLNVRQTERLAKSAPKSGAPRAPKAKDADCAALERDLTTLLGLKVSIDVHGAGGRLSIQYQNLEQLDDLLQRLGRPT